MTPPDDAKVILIGGTSHAGKSTLAQAAATRWNARSISTDALARHPGRPWRDPEEALPDDVKRYFSQPIDGDRGAFLANDVRSHYASNVWPIALAMIRCCLANTYDPPLVLEGSALPPRLVANANLSRCVVLYLRVSNDEIRRRIHATSAYDRRQENARALIDAFTERAIAFQEHLTTDLADTDFVTFDVSHDVDAAKRYLGWI